MKTRIDILGLGCTAVDELLYVAAYPPADAKMRVLRREQHCGGLTSTALVAAARLGAKCAYAGVLGHDESSQFVIRCLRHEGIEVRSVVRRNGARPVQSVIVVDERRKTRNIFFDISSAVGADEKLPARELIMRAKVLLVDNFGIKGMVRAARIARALGIPVVGDFESGDLPGFEQLLRLVDHLILSARFASELTGAKTPSAAVAKLWRPDRSAVIVTQGERGCWFLDGRGGVRRFPAFTVKAVDTTGCGDVFHGAYAVALARGMELTERIRFAAAAAALKTMRTGGQGGIPTLTAVEDFLKQHQA